MDANSEPIVAEQTYSASLAVVWKAITDKDQMRQWFFDAMVDFEPLVGFETEFVVHGEDADYPHIWKITEVIPEQRIVYAWRYGGFDGDSIVTWELSQEPEGTKLTLTHKVVESFPQDNPVFSRESGQSGWDYFLGESLKDFLEMT